ncbi:DUF932 domain-containing protein [Roseomonas mucosa]|uniref:DUF932 domain-containing protein n=1 Tax=Roseomonas mucosa TaxID=207340 RepID=UPI0022470DCE|nr:DUF932 domain-containing protein [Roseomonas mucosa]UZO94569.1 Hypothetical protein RMP42_05913 [Roseomonas mucosa]
MSFIRNRLSFRPDGVTALSDEDIRKLAPSAFAGEAHESRSARYTYIPTAEVIAGMRENGFMPMWAGQARTRDAGRVGHTKHMLRFRHAGAPPAALRRVGDTFPEIVLLNSHDGTSAYRVMSGVFRLACLNGMIVAERQGAEVRVPHKGDVVRQVVEGSYEVLDDARRALEAAEAWRGVTLSRDEQRAFGEAARMLRFGDAEGRTGAPITPEQLLAPRRAEDAGDDLWRTFNRVQENAIRGGLTAWGRDAQNRPRRVTSREVTGIDGDVRLNRALWTLTERMAELKGTA